MNVYAATQILRMFENRKALFITDEMVFAANDAFIDAEHFASAAKLQNLAHLRPCNATCKH